MKKLTKKQMFIKDINHMFYKQSKGAFPFMYKLIEVGLGTKYPEHFDVLNQLAADKLSLRLTLAYFETLETNKIKIILKYNYMQVLAARDCVNRFNVNEFITTKKLTFLK
jgi:hypothetical protein